jgi:hypothetical protein
VGGNEAKGDHSKDQNRTQRKLHDDDDDTEYLTSTRCTVFRCQLLTNFRELLNFVVCVCTLYNVVSSCVAEVLHVRLTLTLKLRF